MSKAEKLNWKVAIIHVKTIIAKVEEFFENFTQYITHLNETNGTNKGKKPANDFIKDHFKKTAQAIRTMKWVIDNLLTTLQTTFFENSEIKKIVSMQELLNFERKRLSSLKAELYRIYEVKQSPFSKISIKTYHRLFRGLYYDYPQDDPLKNILPTVAQIEKERLKQQPAPPSSFIRKLGTQAVAILAAETTSQIVRAVREGMPLQEAVLVAIEGIATVVMAWTAKEGLAAIKEAIKPTVVEEEKVGIREAAEKERLKQAAEKKRLERIERIEEEGKERVERIEKEEEESKLIESAQELGIF